MDNHYSVRRSMQPPPPPSQDHDVLHDKYKKLKRRYTEMEQKFNSMSLDLQRAGEQNRRLTRERDMLLDKILDQGHLVSPDSSSNSVSGPSRMQQEPSSKRSQVPFRPIGEAALQSILDEDSDDDMEPPSRPVVIDYDRDTHSATNENGSERNGNRDREYSVPDRDLYHVSHRPPPGPAHPSPSTYPPHEHAQYPRYPPQHSLHTTQSHPAQATYYPSYATQAPRTTVSPPLPPGRHDMSPPPGFAPARFPSPTSQSEHVSQKRSHEEDDSVRKRQKMQSSTSGHLTTLSASTKPTSSTSSQHSGAQGSPPPSGPPRVRSRGKGQRKGSVDPVRNGAETQDLPVQAKKRKSRAKNAARETSYIEGDYRPDPEQHHTHHPPPSIPPHHGYGPPMPFVPPPMPILVPGMMLPPPPPPMAMHVSQPIPAPVPVAPPIPPPMLPAPPPPPPPRPPRPPSPAIPPPSMPTNIIRTGSTPPRMAYSPAPPAPPPSGPPPRDRSQVPPPPPPPLAPPRPRSTKPKRLKAHTVQRRSWSIPTVPRNPDGQPQLPLNVGIMTVRNLGRVCLEKHFHTERYIFPIGYEVTRRYSSMHHPDVEAQYTCTILRGEDIDGGSGPRFRITASDDPDNPVTAGTATGAWSVIVKAANKVRNRQHSNSVSGPDYFGLGQNTIKHLLQELENAKLLMDYVRQNFVEGGPLGGRHAAVTAAINLDENTKLSEMSNIHGTNSKPSSPVDDDESHDGHEGEHGDDADNSPSYMHGTPSDREHSPQQEQSSPVQVSSSMRGSTNSLEEQRQQAVQKSGDVSTHGRTLRRRRSSQRRYGSPTYSTGSNE